MAEAVKSMSEGDDIVQNKDMMAFLSLLEQLLDTDAVTRITPRQALQHSFVTMAHLEEAMNTSPYVEAAFDLVAVCPLDDDSDDPDDSDDFLSD